MEWVAKASSWVRAIRSQASAASAHQLLDWLTARNLTYSVGLGLPDHTPALLTKIPATGQLLAL